MLILLYALLQSQSALMFWKRAYFHRVLEVTIVLRPSNKAVGRDMLKNKVQVPPKKAK